MADDIELLRIYREGSSNEAFAELVARHVDFVYATALRQVRNRQRAEDVTQIVFTDLARKSQSLLSREEIVGWLYVSARYAAIALVRSEARRQRREIAFEVNRPIADSTPESIDPAALQELIDPALNQLNSADRSAILLRFFKQQSFAAIAATIGGSEESVRKRTQRALEKLRRQLERNGVNSTAAALAIGLANQSCIAAPAGLGASVAAVAVTGATGAVSASTLFFTAMTSTKTIVGSLTLIAALALLSGVYYHRAANAAAEEFSSMRAERDSLKARVAASDSRRRQVEDALADTRRKLEDAQRTSTSGAIEGGAASKGTAKGAATSPKENAPVNPTAGQVLPQRYTNPLGTLWSLRGNPAAMEAWLNAEQSALDLQFGPLFNNLGLSGAQADQLKNIFFERFRTLADIALEAQAHGFSPSSPSIKTLIQESTNKSEAALQSFLGPADYARLQEYGSTMAARDVVKAVASDVYFSESPLTSTQAEQLVRIIAKESPAGSGGSNPDGANWERIVEQAGGILSPVQLAALKAESDQIHLRRQLDLLAKQTPPPGSGH